MPRHPRTGRTRRSRVDEFRLRQRELVEPTVAEPQPRVRDPGVTEGRKLGYMQFLAPPTPERQEDPRLAGVRKFRDKFYADLSADLTQTLAATGKYRAPDEGRGPFRRGLRGGFFLGHADDDELAPRGPLGSEPEPPSLLDRAKYVGGFVAGSLPLAIATGMGTRLALGGVAAARATPSVIARGADFLSRAPVGVRQHIAQNVAMGAGYTAVAEPIRELPEGMTRAESIALHGGMGAGIDVAVGAMLGKFRGLAAGARRGTRDVGVRQLAPGPRRMAEVLEDIPEAEWRFAPPEELAPPVPARRIPERTGTPFDMPGEVAAGQVERTGRGARPYLSRIVEEPEVLPTRDRPGRYGGLSEEQQRIIVEQRVRGGARAVDTPEVVPPPEVTMDEVRRMMARRGMERATARPEPALPEPGPRPEPAPLPEPEPRAVARAIEPVTAPSALDEFGAAVRSLPIKLREPVERALGAQTEGALMTEASNLAGMKMSSDQAGLVQRLLQRAREALPKAESRTPPLPEPRARPAPPTQERPEPGPEMAAATDVTTTRLDVDDTALRVENRNNVDLIEVARAAGDDAEVARLTARNAAISDERAGRHREVPPAAEDVRVQPDEPQVAVVDEPLPAPRAIERAPDAVETGKRLAGVDGAESNVAMPAGEKLAVRYRVVEADELTPSHDPDTWVPNEAFPEEVQGRQYHLSKADQERLVERVTHFDPERALDPTQEIGAGPPTVTPDGITIAGNERVMMLQRLSRDRPEAFAAYREALTARAEQHGLDIEQIAGMKNPVLVREITDPTVDLTDRAVLRELNRQSDVPVGKGRDVVSDAMSRARRLEDSPEALDHMSLTMEEGQTLREYLGTPAGREFVDMMESTGVIESRELAVFRDPKTRALNEDGANMIQRTLQSAAIGDADLVSLARENIKALVGSTEKGGQMEHAFPAIIKASRIEGWDQRGTLQGALRLHIEKAGMPQIKSIYGLVEEQTTLLPRQDEPDAVVLAEFLEGANKTETKAAFHQYALEAEIAREHAAFPGDLFGWKPKTPAAAFDELFGAAALRNRSKKRPCR